MNEILNCAEVLLCVLFFFFSSIKRTLILCELGSVRNQNGRRDERIYQPVELCLSAARTCTTPGTRAWRRARFPGPGP